MDVFLPFIYLDIDFCWAPPPFFWRKPETSTSSPAPEAAKPGDKPHRFFQPAQRKCMSCLSLKLNGSWTCELALDFHLMITRFRPWTQSNNCQNPAGTVAKSKWLCTPKSFFCPECFGHHIWIVRVRTNVHHHKLVLFVENCLGLWCPNPRMLRGFWKTEVCFEILQFGD